MADDAERTIVAVVGATGAVGRVVADALRRQGHHVRAIARSAGVSLDGVQEQGLELQRSATYSRAYNTRDGGMPAIEQIIRSFEQPDEVRVFEKMRLEIVRLHGQAFGRAT